MAAAGMARSGERRSSRTVTEYGVLREMILDGAATDAIRLAAKEQGMRSLRDAGLLAIFDGVTTVEEVLRETIEVF